MSRDVHFVETEPYFQLPSESRNRSKGEYLADFFVPLPTICDEVISPKTVVSSSEETSSTETVVQQAPSTKIVVP